MGCYCKTAAQSLPGFETISTAQGLSQGMVFDLIQDQEGFIWAATKNGLNRYDGYNFKVFMNDPYNTNSLSSNTIIKLLEDSKGRIWAGTENAGVNIYDKKSGKFYRILHQINNTASLTGNNIRTIEEMPDGRILIGTDVAGLNIVELGKEFFSKGTAPTITRLYLPGNSPVYGIGKDQSGNIWVGGMDGTVYRFDPLKNSFILLEHAALLHDGYLNPDSSKLINNNLYLLNGTVLTPLFNQSKTPAGNIIFKPREALWEYHHREEYFYDIYRLEKGNMVNWNQPLVKTTKRICYPFIIDRSGILWSGSVGYGLRKYNNASSKFKTLVNGKSVRLIIPAANKEIYWVGYGYEWFKLINQDNFKDVFPKNPALHQIDNFIIASTKDFWLKSDQRGFFKYNPGNNSLKAYPAIHPNLIYGKKQPFLEDRKGNLWFPGQDGAIAIVNTATEKLDSFSINQDGSKIICTALYEDKQGSVWIGTEKGFAKVNLTNSTGISPTVKWYLNNNNDRNSLNYDHVSCFLEDPIAPDKYLWIATKGGGLNRLDKSNNNFVHLTTKNGLPDDVVYGILPDEAGNIWGSSNKGIFCFSQKNNQQVFYNFTKANGLQDDEFNTGSYARLSNGQLAFGGVNGMNIFDPKEILVGGFMPNVFITDILINNQSVLPGDKTGILQNTVEQTKSITLTHLQDILTLEFCSLDFTASEQNKYRYQLIGVDRDWVESGTRHSATYLHLPPGNYTFKIQGSNSLGIWSDKITELHIKVLPPWWRSWWAYLAYIALLGFAVRAYFKFSVNRAKLKSQLNFEQLEAKRVKELDTVKTQLYTNITHEFRTPLTVILGMAQQVKNDPSHHLDNGIDMIIRNGKSLLNLVNEMLDLSKLETGKMTLQLVHGDIINFLRYIVESFHSLAESQKKQLHFLAQMDVLDVAYDPEKVRQIVANLLSNALKFTPEKGNIYISVSENMVTGAKEKFNLVIKVKDTGIGIPESQLLHIFDRFYQLDNSHTRKTEGTGIGLALTKELVKLMDGEITVKSPPTGANKGSEFIVELPLQKISGTNAANSVQSDVTHHSPVENALISTNGLTINEVKTNPEKPLILLVEDNADVVAYTASCLPEYRLAVGQDGKEGLEIAEELIPDLIITDVMMPFVDGFELCRQLRQQEHTSHIPIIMLTAKADIESKIEGLEKGADAYIEKPFNREELLVRIKKLLELRKNLQHIYLKKAGLQNNLAVHEPIVSDEMPASENTVEDIFVKKVREAIETNLNDTNFSVEQLCKLVFMSHSQLHRKLDALTGCSPNKFIRLIRLKKAKELLQEPSNSIAGIALDCGYNDPGYFARVFKQEFGITPQDWRNKL